MKRTKKYIGVLAPLALSLLVLGGVAALAQKQFLPARSSVRPVVKVSLAGSVERDGKQLGLDAVQTVQPGEILSWQIVSVNEGDAAARDYKAVGHIPSGTSFVAGSAAGESGSTVTYSIDGGTTFSTLPVIEERQPDGSVKQLPAPVSMYTEVRYEWSDALTAGGKLSAAYKVRVR
jgi:uncharacterized repeat protein (TIGR01451 family)